MNVTGRSASTWISTFHVIRTGPSYIIFLRLGLDKALILRITSSSHWLEAKKSQPEFQSISIYSESLTPEFILIGFMNVTGRSASTWISTFHIIRTGPSYIIFQRFGHDKALNLRITSSSHWLEAKKPQPEFQSISIYSESLTLEFILIGFMNVTGRSAST